jgi:hypothetical protein
MKSAKLGKPTSVVEVTNVSRHGFWILIEDEELFLSFESFPWFREASINHILNVTLTQPWHLYWPDLDVDLEVDSIRHPEKYPLIYKAVSRSRSKKT